ncbi:MAG: prepilin-type N-terminal cleavage/methylation domain-containing protein [Elusimicrobiales bacterium]|nr:prepilin-type N-terminal cleavage/methylation domain-containing protein [Elusimicrobiales bacterium]
MRKGFTLIEIMLVILIVGVIGVIAVPKITSAILKTKEKSNIANLSSIREALRLYYSDNSAYPTDDLSSLYPKYISKIPELDIPNSNHTKTDSVRTSNSSSDITDSGMWGYDNVSTSAGFGHVFIDCIHTDLSGKRYCDY